MLPFNESCFRVLHSVMVKKKKKQSTTFTVHSFTHRLPHYLVFSVQESKKGETLKNNQAGTAGAAHPPQCPKIKRFAQNDPKRAGGIVCHRVRGGKVSGESSAGETWGRRGAVVRGWGTGGTAGLSVWGRRCTRMIFLMIL